MTDNLIPHGFDQRTELLICSLYLQDTVWCNGCLVRHPAPPTAAVLPSVQECIGGTRAGRLYLTDCSMPDYEARGYPRSAPGMPCAVDASANAMLPHAVRSNRATNLFHFIKVSCQVHNTRSMPFFS